MRVKRLNVFETNSSSTHSFSWGDTCNDLAISIEDNLIYSSLGEFGWRIEDFPDASDKLAYILLVAAYFENCNFWYSSNDWDVEYSNFKQSLLFKEIEKAVMEHTGCSGIAIRKKSEGYIDHQSLEYDSFENWLEDSGAESIEDFIFGNVILHTDNDNH